MDIQLINTLKDRPGRIPEVARVEHGCGRRGPLLVGDIVHGRDDKPELPWRIRSVPRTDGQTGKVKVTPCQSLPPVACVKVVEGTSD
jgi:hypothetical protein